MVGRDVLLRVDKPAARARRARARGRATCAVRDDRGLPAVRGVVARRCARARSSASPASRATARPSWSRRSPACARRQPGAIALDGQRRHRRRRARDGSTPASRTSPRTASGAGWCCDFTLAENLALREYRPAADARAAGCSTRRACASARAQLLEEYDVRGGGARRAARRALGRQPAEGRRRPRDRRATRSVLVAAQPTRGLDVGAIEFVHRRWSPSATRAAAILLVSLELDEVRSLADRILVIYEGADRRRVPARRVRGGARHRDDRRRARGRGAGVSRRPTAGARGPGRRPSPRGWPPTCAAAASSSPSSRRCSPSSIGGLVMLVTGHDPIVDLQGDLRRHRAELALPVGHRRRPADRGAEPAADADPHHAADPHRPRGGVRLPRRPVQHRRPGPVHRRRRSRRSGSARRSPGCPACCTSCSRSSPPRWRARPGRASPGVLKATVGRQRGDLDDHAQLHRALGRARTCSRSAARCRTRPRSSPCRSPTTSSPAPSCPSSGATRSCRACTSASSSRSRRWSSSGCSSTARRPATRCARSASTPRRPATAASASPRNYVLVMAVCGAFAGLAGAMDVLGWQFRIATNDIQLSQSASSASPSPCSGATRRSARCRRRCCSARCSAARRSATSTRRSSSPSWPANLTTSSRASSCCSSAPTCSCSACCGAGAGCCRGAGRRSAAAPEAERVSAAAARRDAAARVNARNVGWAGIALGVVAWYIALPPLLVRTPVPSLVLALLGDRRRRAGGRAAASAGSGWGAVVAGVVGAIGAVAATQSGAGNLEGRRLVGAVRGDAALRDAADLRAPSAGSSPSAAAS